MAIYIHELSNWPSFEWNQDIINPLLSKLQHQQGRLLGRMEALGFGLQAEANLETLTLDVIKSSEIEGEVLDSQQVRSSIARRLGMDIAGLVPADRNVEGVVEMMLNATQHYNEQLTKERLFAWQASLFPAGYSGMQKIAVGKWRDNSKNDPMQVVSGPMGRETVHYEAPEATLLEKEMLKFLDWVNEKNNRDTLLSAAIAHLWFVTIHPFDDGNGRIARAITDMLLARSDATAMRFYSMSGQIRKERKEYYIILEQTQKGSLDITIWIQWFLGCLERAFAEVSNTLALILKKASFWERNSVHQFNQRQKLMMNMLIDGFVGKLNTSKWAKITKCSNDTALRDIQDLLTKNVLEKEEAGGRSTSYKLVSP